MRSCPRGYPIGREHPHPRALPPIGWPLSGTFGRYLQGGAPAHPPYPTRRRIPDCRSLFHEGPISNGRNSSHATASAAGHSPGRYGARGGDLARAGVGRANGAPKPILDVISTPENTPINGNVLDNDINLGSGTLTVTDFVALAPSIGTLTIEADGDFVFTPADHWTGTTTTTYEVSNGSHSHDGDIQITVTPINEAPVANDDTATVDEDTPTDVTAQLLANDTDPDGDTLVVTAASNATGGSVDVTSNVVTFTPAADYCGAAGFDYDISDGNGGTDSASVTVNVTCPTTRRSPSTTLPRPPRTRRDDRSGRPPDQRHRRRCGDTLWSPPSRTPPTARSSSTRAASPSRLMPTTAAAAGLRLRHQRRQRRHRQRQRDGQRQLHQRRAGRRRRHCLGHRGHAGDRSIRPTS